MKNHNFLYKIAPCLIRIGVIICTLISSISIYFIKHDIKVVCFCLLINLSIGIWTFVALSLLAKILSYMSSDFNSIIDEMMNETYQPNQFIEDDTIISKMNGQLDRLYSIMQYHKEQIYKEKEELQQFISDISHQVKSPITNSEVAIDSILELDLNEREKQEYLTLIRCQVEKLKFLMDALIKVSRLETGILVIKKEYKSIHETILQALTDIILRAEQKSLQIHVNCSKDLYILHDVKWTIEAIYNILDNAVKYTNQNGKIHINVIDKASYVIVNIEDTGKGIIENNLGAVFHRFYREPDVHNIEGNGLGLFLSQKIITLQGGYIQLNSRLGEGTIVSLYFLKE